MEEQIYRIEEIPRSLVAPLSRGRRILSMHIYPMPAANTATALGNPRGKKLFVLLRKLLSKWC